jgi:hypothetical protein
MTDEGYACSFCVEGADVAGRIIALLSRAFAFQTSEPMREGDRPTQRIFRVAYGSQLSQQDLVRLLSAVPGLRLQVIPAAKRSLTGRSH